MRDVCRLTGAGADSAPGVVAVTVDSGGDVALLGAVADAIAGETVQRH